MAAFFTFTTFLAALLLFSVQPLVARLILPSLGGSPAVWNTAMVFFQAVLLGGYLYSHAIGQRLNVARRATLIGHGVLLLLPLGFLPLAVAKGLAPPATAQPILWLLGVLSACVGVPFFVLSTSSPLMQRLFALTPHRDAKDPYFLYAASNAGSLIALLAYPLYFEPNFDLTTQTHLWAALYLVFVPCFWGCLITVLRLKPQDVPAIEDAQVESVAATPISWARRFRWVVLALVPSSLMLSVTTYLSSNVAAIPLLWIVPLSLYLASFMVVFARRPLLPQTVWPRALVILILPLVVVLDARANGPLALLIPLHLGAFFVAAVVCHGELARDRPPATKLTEFYGWMALGGVLGGALNSLVAPLVFSDVVEYPISLFVLALLLPRDLLRDDKNAPEARFLPNVLDFALPFGVGALCYLLVIGLQAQKIASGPLATALMFGIPTFLSFPFSRRPLRFALAIGAILWCGTAYHGAVTSGVLEARRSFFGVHRVVLSPDGKFVVLMHGSTLHGVERTGAGSREPLSYYSRQGPVGDILRVAIAKKKTLRVAVVGLGGGTLAAYIQPRQKWTFYEIDPLVAQIAHDTRFFHYLSDSPVKSSLILGDARLKLQSAPRGAYDLILLDAYSSDSIPVHLLTREAVGLYLDKLAPGGLIGWHISNHNFDLEPVVGKLALNAGLSGLNRSDEGQGLAPSDWIMSSQWAVLGRQPSDLDAFRGMKTWKLLRNDAPLWTDERSSLWELLVRKWAKGN